MAKPGYQAVALDAPVAATLRDIAHHLSLTQGTRYTLSDTLAQLIRWWLVQAELPPAAEAAIRDRLAPRGGAALDIPARQP